MVHCLRNIQSTNNWISRQLFLYCAFCALCIRCSARTFSLHFNDKSTDTFVLNGNEIVFNEEKYSCWKEHYLQYMLFWTRNVRVGNLFFFVFFFAIVYFFLFDIIFVSVLVQQSFACENHIGEPCLPGWKIKLKILFEMVLRTIHNRRDKTMKHFKHSP